MLLVRFPFPTVTVTTVVDALNTAKSVFITREVSLHLNLKAALSLNRAMVNDDQDFDAIMSGMRLRCAGTYYVLPPVTEAPT